MPLCVVAILTSSVRQFIRHSSHSSTMDLSSLDPLDRPFFRHVPFHPIEIRIGLYMGMEEAQQVFPNIPELAGIQDFVDAVEADRIIRKELT